MRVIISLLSDQPIPNVLFIREMAKPGDRHYFLSTERMEKLGMSENIAAATGLAQEQYSVIEIDANDPGLILNVLDNHDWPSAAINIVNITGGTKMMSQMAYIHFSERQNTEIYYWPIGAAAIQMLHPYIKQVPVKYPNSLDLKTYLKAHGFDSSAQTRLTYPFTKADKLFRATINSGSAGNVPEIRDAKHEHYVGADKNYLIGGWFEEWLYAFLKRELQLGENAIAFNLKIKSRHSLRNSDSDNEVDVAFVYNNRLYLWECKVFNSTYIAGKKIAEVVYKISSLTHLLGLHAASLVVIFTPFGYDANRKTFLNDITRLMRVKKVCSMEDLVDTNVFINEIKKLIVYGS